jgi:hypothetical protein
MVDTFIFASKESQTMGLLKHSVYGFLAHFNVFFNRLGRFCKHLKAFSSKVF